MTIKMKFLFVFVVAAVHLSLSILLVKYSETGIPGLTNGDMSQSMLDAFEMAGYILLFPLSLLFFYTDPGKWPQIPVYLAYSILFTNSLIWGVMLLVIKQIFSRTR